MRALCSRLMLTYGLAPSSEPLMVAARGALVAGEPYHPAGSASSQSAAGASTGLRAYATAADGITEKAGASPTAAPAGLGQAPSKPTTAAFRQASPASTSSLPSSAGASSVAASAAAPAPFYAHLAARYPDPDHVPAATLQRLRNQLFGRAVRPHEATGRRALARPLQGRQLAEWYFTPASEAPGFHNEEKEYELRRALNRRHVKEAEADEPAAGGKKKK